MTTLYHFRDYLVDYMETMRNQALNGVGEVEDVIEAYQTHCWVMFESLMSDALLYHYCAISWQAMGLPDCPAHIPYLEINGDSIPNYKYNGLFMLSEHEHAYEVTVAAPAV